jgi:hypothetical protein
VADGVTREMGSDGVALLATIRKTM